MGNISEPVFIIYEPIKLIDEVSTQLFYIGTASYNATSSSIWKIKKN